MKKALLFVAASLVVIACCLESWGTIQSFFAGDGLKLINTYYSNGGKTKLVLYGNDEAKDATYQKKTGAVFELLTYKEQESDYLFEASTTSLLVKTETVSFVTDRMGRLKSNYKRVDSFKLKNEKQESITARIKFITTLQSENEKQ